MERVNVWRGGYGHAVPPFGPLPGMRDGNALAYEFELPEAYQPWEGLTRLERSFVLLDLGVGMALPCWRTRNEADGRVTPGVDSSGQRPVTWYVDLLAVTDEGTDVFVRDLYVDVIVPLDGRHPRMLDLEEYADAIEAGTVPVETGLDGLRRWQAFLDRCLHKERDPIHGYSDFPPAAIRRLMDEPAPLGPVVIAPG